ncbi:hypothetical protein Fmac_031961 [Flemingia macrophylla]|uniref:Polygalacturonase n=1 Tax=Flemingia macrophylla TaxID=520843 RepID=A0ABD1L3K2_9FABA
MKLTGRCQKGDRSRAKGGSYRCGYGGDAQGRSGYGGGGVAVTIGVKLKVSVAIGVKGHEGVKSMGDFGRGRVEGRRNGAERESKSPEETRATVAVALSVRGELWVATDNLFIYGYVGGKGYAKDIMFVNISVNQTNYPKDAIKVSDVTFSNICGTCTNENAVVLDCAKIRCDNINLNQINITSIDPKKPASATCNNVHGKTANIFSPSVSCLH